MDDHTTRTSQPPIPKLLCDVMLGSLAKWLRILGLDTSYDNRIEDGAIVLQCVQEDRIALTRDRLLTYRRLLRDRSLLIESRRLENQLREVLKHIGVRPDTIRLLSRCLVCNNELDQISREAARPLVFPYVYRTQETLKQCAACARVYWRGSHREKIRHELREWGFQERSGERYGRGNATSSRPVIILNIS